MRNVYPSHNNFIVNYCVNLILFSVIHIIDLNSNKDTTAIIKHNIEIIQLALDQNNNGQSFSTKIMAFLDIAKDLYIVSLYSQQKRLLKLGNEQNNKLQ